MNVAPVDANAEVICPALETCPVQEKDAPVPVVPLQLEKTPDALVKTALKLPISVPV
jgi:hypothetical protein